MRKGPLERDQIGIAMHQDMIKIMLDPIQHFHQAFRLGRGDQNIADRTGDDGPVRGRQRGVQQGQQFKPHLPPAKGVKLQQKNLRLEIRPRTS